MSNQTKNTREQIKKILSLFEQNIIHDLQDMGANPELEPTEFIQKTSAQILAMLTQTKQETIQSCKDALPEKTDRFTDPTDWVGINKTVDNAHTALNKLGDK
jgi:hypothetical protein